MAAPLSRSPSPLSSRHNPQSRNSESDPTIRRSFTGNLFSRPSVVTQPKRLNPITPANSPAGFGRRNSVGKEGIGNFHRCDEKENDRNQNSKQSKLQSSRNGSKNFMSPTISAASKFTPSPRKKVLVDRNEPVRTSISLSEGKATFFSEVNSEIDEDLVPKSESFVDQRKGVEDNFESTIVTGLDKTQAGFECPPASKPLKRVTFAEIALDSQNVILDYDSVSTDSSPKSKKSSCFPASPIISPLDADPSLPPYDPKTNYLSLRPQFLHYRANPRIEVLLSKEKEFDLGEGKNLEDTFVFEVLSENFSDIDGMKESSNSKDSYKDSEDSSLAEVEGPEAKQEIHVLETIPVSTVSEPVSISTPTILISEKIVEGKKKEKKGFFVRLKLLSLLLVFLIACISISVNYSHRIDSSTLKTLNFSKMPDPSKVVDFAIANFDGIAGNFKELLYDSIFQLSMLINNIGKGDKLSPLKYVNITDLENDIMVGHQWSEKFPENLEDKEIEEEQDAEMEQVKETEESEELSSTHTPLAEIDEPESCDTLWNQEEATSQVDTQLHYGVNSEDYQAPGLEAPETESETRAPEMEPETKAPEMEPEATKTGIFKGEMEFHPGVKVESPIADIKEESNSAVIHSIVEHTSSEMVEPSLGGSKNTFLDYYLTEAASLVLALISAAAFAYVKCSNDGNPTIVVKTDQSLNKKMVPASSTLEQMYQSRQSSQNWPTEDDIGESCPSEISSFEKSSSHTKLRRANKAQNQERKSRNYSKRESLASSSEYSMDSPSYGSFTTHERIPSKHENGDDEIMTPVRRSSRFRNQVTPSYATLCIRENLGCLFIATNHDVVTHLTDAQEWAGGGSMVGAIWGSTKHEPHVVEKPSTFMMDYLANKFGILKSQICMVGDRLDTDILFGQNGGCKTLLVLSGVTSLSMLQSPNNSIQPDFYTNKISDFVSLKAAAV